MNPNLRFYVQSYLLPNRLHHVWLQSIDLLNQKDKKVLLATDLTEEQAQNIHQLVNESIITNL